MTDSTATMTDLTRPMRRRDPDAAARVHAFRVGRAVEWFTARAGGSFDRLCPICGYEGPFSPVRRKLDVWCPGCDSRPRHRLMQLWLDRAADVAADARVLHFAAEPWLRDWFTSRVARYVTADLNGRYELTLNIEAIDLPDASFDLVIASHVLEHVDDRAALRELYRILAPGGRAALAVPLVEGWAETLERPEYDTPELRARYYDDPDHRRFYGRDFRDRLRAAGFAVSEFTAIEPDVARHGLSRGESLFVGRKGAG